MDNNCRDSSVSKQTRRPRRSKFSRVPVVPRLRNHFHERVRIIAMTQSPERLALQSSIIIGSLFCLSNFTRTTHLRRRSRPYETCEKQRCPKLGNYFRGEGGLHDEKKFGQHGYRGSGVQWRIPVAVGRMPSDCGRRFGNIFWFRDWYAPAGW